ncbi:predicted protein [Streptomyces viridochromogenes DSM 40736]|uniref:Predicted protein n=1 Tax=Streptomyces viridochromogenes (strain DSM 40736 / JCM 4977 / BCRC 1201 / Tue 494) TaxID=591159 RepID=D9XGZ9_STRVT|nr:predicted protein [Streptomyces viridochromogenes DSM 40736]
MVTDAEGVGGGRRVRIDCSDARKEARADGSEVAEVVGLAPDLEPAGSCHIGRSGSGPPNEMGVSTSNLTPDGAPDDLVSTRPSDTRGAP